MEFTIRDFISSIMNFNYHQAAHNCILIHHPDLANDLGFNKNMFTLQSPQHRLPLLRYLNIITCKAAIMPATLSVCWSRVPSSNPFVVSDAWPCQEQGLPYNQALCRHIFIVTWLVYRFVIFLVKSKKYLYWKIFCLMQAKYLHWMWVLVIEYLIHYTGK